MLSYKLNNQFDLDKLYFTGDSHFGHTNIIKYCNRPFKFTKEHDESLIKNWNEKVPKDGIIFHLGDFGLGSPGYLFSIIRRLNGKIYFIRGNHDKSMKGEVLNFIQCDLPYCEINIPIKGHKNGKRLVVLCHYAFEVWNKRHYDSWHLHGHSHGTLKTKIKNRMDVGVDNCNYFPVSYYEVEEKFSKEK